MRQPRFTYVKNKGANKKARVAVPIPWKSFIGITGRKESPDGRKNASDCMKTEIPEKETVKEASAAAREGETERHSAARETAVPTSKKAEKQAEITAF